MTASVSSFPAAYSSSSQSSS